MKGHLISLALLVALLGSVYAQVSDFEFLNWDDDVNVTANPHLNPPEWSALGAFWSEPYASLYVPVAYSFFLAEARLSHELYGELHPGLFHVGTLLLHLGATWLVYLLLRRFTGKWGAACAGAALFAVHPLQAEAVAWVTETRGLLAALFSLAAILLHLASRDGNRTRLGPYLGGSVCFALALLAKPSAVAAPLLAGLLDRRSPSDEAPLPWLLVARRLAPWFALAAVVVVISKALQPDAASGWVPALWQRPLVAGDALAFYLWKLVWPVDLAADYGRTPAVVFERGWVRFTAWVPAALLLLFVARGWRTLTRSLLLFCAALLPVLGLIPFTYQVFSTVADRYAYLALLGPAFLFATLLARARSRWVWPAAIALVLAAGLGARFQAEHWHNPRRLFGHVLELHPASWTAHNNLGALKSLEGDLEGAAAHYELALEARPDYFQAHYNLGALLARLDQKERAANHLQRALQLGSGYEPARVELGRVAYNLGVEAFAREDWDAAAVSFELSAGVRPDYALAHRGLGRAHLAAGRGAQAIGPLERALELAPDDVETLFLRGVARESTGDAAAAAESFRAVLARVPNHPAARRALARIESRPPTNGAAGD